MKAAELRASILQEAVSGKLVPQIASEGTADELLRQIEAECAALIKAGKIKKEKPLPEITEDEIPFEIPKSWKWVRLGEICEYIHRGKSPVYSPIKQIPVVAQKCVQWSGVSLEKALFIDPNSIQKYTIEQHLKTGDLLLNSTGLGTLGRIGVYDEKINSYEFSVADSHVTVIRPCNHQVNSTYLYSWFSGPYVQDNIEDKGSGSTKQKELATDTVKNHLVPLPPLSEQKRIVAKLEELLPLIDQYAEEEEKLSAISAQFPDAMRKSILLEAVSGKLVPQIVSEGTAEELLIQIEAERASLSKVGMIKKEKPLPEITEDEIPFDIPKSWKWVRLGEICNVETGNLDANAQDELGVYPFFTCGDEVFKTKTAAFNTEAVLLGGNNASGDFKMHYYFGEFNAYQRVYVITKFGNLNLRYIMKVVAYYLPLLKRLAKGTTTKYLLLSHVLELMIPLPPLSEQKRIVTKLEELMQIIDKLN